MPMIPLTFLPAIVIVLFLVIEASKGSAAGGSVFLRILLAVVAFQLILVGIRFGYDVEVLGRIYPYIAALVPPLAYLGFTNPGTGLRQHPHLYLVHLLPLASALITTLFARDYIDVVQGLFTLGYSLALLVIALRGPSAFSWASINQSNRYLVGIWMTTGLLFLSGITDLQIAADFYRHEGRNLSKIAGSAVLVSTVVASVLSMILWFFFKSKRKSNQAPGTHSNASQVIQAVDRLLQRSQIHLDPDLNLNRIARKLTIPARRVSTAINQETGLSVSRYINQMRIEHACHLLRTTDQPITSILLQSGFNTKSNFNREFQRIQGISPSQWRKENDE